MIVYMRMCAYVGLQFCARYRREDRMSERMCVYNINVLYTNVCQCVILYLYISLYVYVCLRRSSVAQGGGEETGE